ncbi:MAG: nucleoside deaminase [Corynebacterium sp.]|uniref:nucleoside deaminase n=1 Tax=Corynebacterium sp. TaxID=1720 RepID=UPI0026DA9701|nr:nucleoside deaminase [Corynebacterium sp.]MDO4761468.1 nucleoside deaminase [Corynebacterium sp.]
MPRPGFVTQAEAWMREALVEAARTPAGDVPVGAIILNPEGVIIGRGHNRREADCDPLGHAEIMAMTQAVGAHGDRWRLSNCTLVATLEPCAMCAGALVGARIGRIIFGAFEPKTGACGSLIDIPRAPGALYSPEILAGVLEEECAGLLTKFFGSIRGEH